MRSSLTFSPGHDLILIVKFEKVTKLYQRNQLHGTGADLGWGGGGGVRGGRGPPFFLYLRKVLKVPIHPKLLFCLNKYMCNSEQNGAKIFDLGQNRNFL